MPHLIIMVGLPGSGKSTYANKLLKKNPEVIYICRDSLREAIGEYANFSPTRESIVREMKQLALKKALQNNATVILDECHLTAAFRKRTIPREGTFEVIYVKEDGKDLLGRRMNSPKGQDKNTWKKVIESMKSSFERPTLEEFTEYSNFINLKEVS